MEPGWSLLYSKSPPLVRFISHIYSVHSAIIMTHFITVLPAVSRFSKWPPSFRLSKIVYVSTLRICSSCSSFQNHNMQYWLEDRSDTDSSYSQIIITVYTYSDGFILWSLLFGFSALWSQTSSSRAWWKTRLLTFRLPAPGAAWRIHRMSCCPTSNRCCSMPRSLMPLLH